MHNFCANITQSNDFLVTLTFGIHFSFWNKNQRAISHHLTWAWCRLAAVGSGRPAPTRHAGGGRWSTLSPALWAGGPYPWVECENVPNVRTIFFLGWLMKNTSNFSVGNTLAFLKQLLFTFYYSFLICGSCDFPTAFIYVTEFTAWKLRNQVSGCVPARVKASVRHTEQ